MYQRIGKAAYKADLSNTLQLASYLNHPERSFKNVHVAGTNGKGSTSHMLASVLQEAGYKVGLYTSPHLIDFRERIKINGEMIPKRTVSAFVNKHKTFFETNSLSFFEMTVGLAFDYFRSKKVDIAIIEVGLGGRLDSTNIITPELVVITNIGFDHTQFLGNTISQIASEKGGIIKPNIPVVIGESTQETKKVFEAIASSKKAPIFYAEERTFPTYTSDLKGAYQKLNIRTALTAISILVKEDWHISEADITQGLDAVIKNTGLRGRWETIGLNPRVVCDTAHNKEGLELVLKQLQDQTFDRLHIVLGMVSDKNLDEVLPLFPLEASYYFCKPDVQRGLDASQLAAAGKQFGLHGLPYKSVKTALKTAKEMASDTDLIYVGGSTFVVAEVL